MAKKLISYDDEQAGDAALPEPVNEVLRATYVRSGITSALAKLRASLMLRDAMPVVVVGLGSSTTSGAGASTPGSRYINKLAAQLQAAYPLSTGEGSPQTKTLAEAVADPPVAPGVQVVNGGASGMGAASYITTTTRPQIIALNPSAIIHMVGSNDYGMDVPISTYRTHLTNQIASLKSGITVPCVHILANSYQRLDKTGALHAWSEYRDAMKEVAAADPDNVAFIDLSPPWVEVGVPGSDPLRLIYDTVHPTDRGHALLADQVLEAIGISRVPAQLVTTEPPAVTGLTLTPFESAIQVVWNPSVTATSYLLEHRTGAGSWTAVTVHTRDQTISGLTSGTSYDVRVTPVNGVGSGTPATGTESTLAGSNLVALTSDSFTGSNGTIHGRSTDASLGGAPMTWSLSTPGTAPYVIESNVLRRGGVAGTQVGTLATGLDDVSVSFKIVSLPNESYWFDLRRVGADCYRIQVDASGAVRPMKRVGGVVTNLDTPTTFAAGDTAELEIVGSTLVMKKNGVTVSNAEDTALTAPGSVALSVGAVITDFAIDDVVVKSEPVPSTIPGTRSEITNMQNLSPAHTGAATLYVAATLPASGGNFTVSARSNDSTRLLSVQANQTSSVDLSSVITGGGTTNTSYPDPKAVPGPRVYALSVSATGGAVISRRGSDTALQSSPTPGNILVETVRVVANGGAVVHGAYMYLDTAHSASEIALAQEEIRALHGLASI